MSKPLSTTKASHALKVPYTAPSWPVVPLEIEASILDVLIPFLHPIGQCRDRATKLSKGRKKKRSKRTSLNPGDVDGKDAEIDTEPNMTHHLTVGFNSTVRRLESLCREDHTQEQTSDEKPKVLEGLLSAILVCSNTLPDIMTAPLPLLAALASAHRPSNTAIRIVSISPNGCLRMAETLKQPRLNVIGVECNTPGMEQLEKLLQENIKPIEVPWIREAAEWQYQSVQIDTQRVAPGDKARDRKRKRSNAEDT